MWWMRISVVLAHGPPTRPPFARNSSIIVVLKSLARPGADSTTISSHALDILVMAADPGLERFALAAPLRRPVEDRVVTHQELDPAACRRIGLVDGAVLDCEGAHRRRFGEVSGDIGSGRGRVLSHDRRQAALVEAP